MRRTEAVITGLRFWWRLPLAGSLLLLMTTSAAVELRIQDGLISIDVEDVTVQEVLDALVDEHNLRLVQQSPMLRKVSLRMQGEPLTAVLDRLLETSDSYQLFLPPREYSDEHGRGAPAVLWLFADGLSDAYAIEYLETVLLGGGLGEKRAAIRKLRDIGSPAAVQSLSFALGDEDKRIRNAAIEALTAIGSSESLAALASSVSAEDPETRAAAAEALAGAGGRSAAGYLDLALTDDDPRVRMAAAEALGDVGDETARARLRAALADPDPAVRERAAEVLEDLNDEAMFHTLFPPQ